MIMKRDHVVLGVFSLLILGIVIAILVLVVTLKKDCKGSNNIKPSPSLKKASAADIKTGKTFVLGITQGNAFIAINPSTSGLTQIPLTQVTSAQNDDLHLQAITAAGNLNLVQATNTSNALQAIVPPSNIPVFNTGSAPATINPKGAGAGGKIAIMVGTDYLHINPSSSPALFYSQTPQGFDAYLV